MAALDERGLAKLCRALADPSRLRIMTLLGMDLCVGALAQRTDLSDSAVSQHLAHLREAGLVEGEKRSYWTHYRVQTHVLRELSDLLTELADALDEAAPGCQCGREGITCRGGRCPMMKE